MRTSPIILDLLGGNGNTLNEEDKKIKQSGKGGVLRYR
jgi:hypothetical protein